MQFSEIAKILVIDDNLQFCKSIKRFLELEGYLVTYLLTINDGLHELKDKDFDLVLLDVELPDGNGIEFISEIKNFSSIPEIIILTGYADSNSAKIAIESGAWDYIEKGTGFDNVMLPVLRSLEYRVEKKKNFKLNMFNRQEIIGSSWELYQCIDFASKISKSDANVLILGETGAGKENFARSIYRNSHRADENFVVVDCTILPENLVESVLFGHTKGAFTGADKTSSGLIAKADKGTLFLDEIGDLPLKAQKSFLRVLQEKEYRQVGSSQLLKSDFRLIAATNKNLNELKEKREFREDLLFRINSNHIELPPLRKRGKDVEEIVDYYLPILCNTHGLHLKNMSSECMELYSFYSWPGNVRELIHTLESSILNSGLEKTIDIHHLPNKLKLLRINLKLNHKGKHVNESGKAINNSDFVMPFKEYKQQAVDLAEKQYFSDMLKRYGNDLNKIMEISSLGKSRVYSILNKHKLI